MTTLDSMQDIAADNVSEQLIALTYATVNAVKRQDVGAALVAARQLFVFLEEYSDFISSEESQRSARLFWCVDQLAVDGFDEDFWREALG